MYKLRCLVGLWWAMVRTTVTRLVRGRRRPGWTWTFEMMTVYMRSRVQAALRLPTVEKQRRFGDALVFPSRAVPQVNIESTEAGGRPARWFAPKEGVGGTTVLYLHGGAYGYYPRLYDNFIAWVVLAAKSRTLVPDFRLAPEHPWPAALEDALSAYDALLAGGVDPKRLVLAGDSAGGNLALVTLLSLRDRRKPLPALAVCLAPWVDLENSGESMTRNAPYDWISLEQSRMAARAYGGSASLRNPMISPIHADFRGLPPIYVQVGGAEILHDQIRAFADRARGQGAAVTLDEFDDMNHVFQAFGDVVPQSMAALRRIGEEVARLN